MLNLKSTTLCISITALMTAVLASYTFNDPPPPPHIGIACVFGNSIFFQAPSVRKCKEYRKNIRRNKNLIEICYIDTHIYIYIYTLSGTSTNRLVLMLFALWCGKHWMSSSHEIIFGSTCVRCLRFSFILQGFISP